jgi:hypothetical protein
MLPATDKGAVVLRQILPRASVTDRQRRGIFVGVIGAKS